MTLPMTFDDEKLAAMRAVAERAKEVAPGDWLWAKHSAIVVSRGADGGGPTLLANCDVMRERDEAASDACQTIAQWIAVAAPRQVLALIDDLLAVRGEGWRPISTAPKDGTLVVIGRDMGDFGFVRGVGYWAAFKGIDGWIATAGFSDPPGVLGLAHPTHWFHVDRAPALPIEEGG